jgi:hypothetical protein
MLGLVRLLLIKDFRLEVHIRIVSTKVPHERFNQKPFDSK